MKKFNIKEDDVINIDKYINERAKIKKETTEQKVEALLILLR